MTLVVNMLGGNCPVQAEGTIGGKRFYFRSRGKHWSFCVGDDPYGDPDFEICTKYSDQEFAAGWIDEKEALGIIELCAAAYGLFEDIKL